MWIKADKSRNLYKINSLQYIKILHKIREKYKLDYDDIKCQFNDTYKLANKLNIKNKLG